MSDKRRLPSPPTPLASLHGRGEKDVSQTFFHLSLGTIAFPIGAANRLRDEMHPELMRLSAEQIQLSADRSSHFVWIDEPYIIVKASEMMLEKY